jgi:tRNA U34 5-methylaminomethyl-2-thiouridine-forming methyltransferase MnmC
MAHPTVIPELKLVETADGSKTIYNAQVGENYHSRNGALQESRHVFINSGLNYFLADGADHISVLEVGFGTGLNFLLSADVCAAQNIQLKYTGIEAYPLSPQMIGDTGYGQYVSPEIWNSFQEHYTGALQSPVNLNAACQLQIANCPLLDFNNNLQYDVIYFDAFAAARQPEMWNGEAIGHTIQFLNTGGVFVTYPITGNLKRMLKGMGLQIQKIPGAAGKREMLRAVR